MMQRCWLGRMGSEIVVNTGNEDANFTGNFLVTNGLTGAIIPHEILHIGNVHHTHEEYGLFESEVICELRFPIIAKSELMGAFFYDGGQVLVDGFGFEDKWRDAVGVGLRYNTPIGPLNLEYAQKLDRKEDEDEGAFHLSVGVF